MTASLGPTLAQLCPNVVRRQFKASTPIACDTRTHLIFVDGGWQAFGVPNKRPPDTSLIIIRPTPPHHFTFPIALCSPARLPKKAMLDPGQHPSALGISQFPKPFIWHFVENRGLCCLSDYRREAPAPRSLPLYWQAPIQWSDEVSRQERQALSGSGSQAARCITSGTGCSVLPGSLVSSERRDSSALTHTRESLREQYPGVDGIGNVTADVMDRVLRNVLYVEDGASDYWFRDPSLRENERSVGGGDSGEGCFSLAGTILQGEGEGIYLPALQTTLSRVSTRSKELFGYISTLYRHMCIMGKRADHLMSGFAEQLINNAPCIGDGEWGPTSVQVNVHYSDHEFSETIGIDQSEPHPDDQDEPCHPALLIHITTTPYGMSTLSKQNAVV